MATCGVDGEWDDGIGDDGLESLSVILYGSSHLENEMKYNEH